MTMKTLKKQTFNCSGSLMVLMVQSIFIMMEEYGGV